MDGGGERAVVDGLFFAWMNGWLVYRLGYSLSLLAERMDFLVADDIPGLCLRGIMALYCRRIWLRSWHWAEWWHGRGDCGCRCRLVKEHGIEGF